MKKTALVLGMAAALTAGTASAHEAGSFLLRAGGVFVFGTFSLRYQNINWNWFKLNDNAQLGLTGTYMITDNIGVELLGATPFSHSIDGNIPSMNKNLGEVVKLKQLPPSLYLQYYFLDKDSPSRPYIGAGWTILVSLMQKLKMMPLVIWKLINIHSVRLANAGIDIKLTDNLFFNTAMVHILKRLRNLKHWVVIMKLM